ncbi:MAG: peptide/nickel transport system substrate-binding protein [Acidobacteriota bacterium]|jgi:peptide/nickel transport system substrate-binding protein|nr:peptide/nickel transport system substrate-binding protein [Acidobacteriota bacterium]
MRLRSARPLFAVLSVLLLVAGCKGNSEEGAGTTPTPAAAAGQDPGQPRRGGTAVIGWSAAATGVNELITQGTAITTEVTRQLFLQLVQEQADFEEHPPTFKPLLASSYEFSPDRKTLTFHLRKDAVWSDGVPITADDVRFTWQAQRHPDVGWDSAYMVEHITDVEVVDPKTARYHFAKTYAKQLQDANEGVILPKHAWEKIPFPKWRENNDWFREHLVVSGPFTVGTWEPQQQVVLVRNPRYFRQDRPYLDKVVIRNIADPASLLTQLFSGEVDFVPQVQPVDMERIQADPRLRVIPYWFRLYVCVIWNERNPLFADADVRRALTLGIDRQTIVDTLFPHGTARIAVSPIVQSVWAFDRSLGALPYDPQESRRILESKGWKDSNGDGILDKEGKPFSFVLLSNGGNQQRNDAAVMIQEQLKQAGVRAEPRVVEFNTLVNDATGGTFEAMVFGFNIDTSMDMTAQFGSEAMEEGNFGAYKNPEFDRLMAEAMGKPDIRDAKPILDRIQQIIHRDQPATFLWESQRMSAINRRIQGARPNVLFSLFNLEDWWVADL